MGASGMLRLARPLLRPSLAGCTRICQRFDSSPPANGNSDDIDVDNTLLGVPGDSEVIGRWMGDPDLVDPLGWGTGQIGVIRRMEMYTMLHLVPGFNLPEFLDGTRYGYGAVTRLMYAKDWDALEGLVAPACLDAMVATMDDIAGDRRRIQEFEDQDAVQIKSATLTNVLLLDDPSFQTGDPRKVHIDVRFVSTERWVMHDYTDNAPIKPFDGTPFEQNATLRWEGEIVPPGNDAEARNWKLFALV